MVQNLGARYGIWGENPYGPDVGSIALETAMGLGKLFGLGRENRERALKNQQMEAVMPGLIEAANAENAAKAQFASPLQQAELGLKNATIGHLGAQSDQARAMADFDRMRARLGLGGLFAASGGLGAGNTMPQLDKNGNVISIESPTTPSATQSQNRIAAEAEMQKIWPIVEKGLNHYVGLAGKGQFLKDIYTYKMSPNTKEGMAARQRLYEYDLAKRYSTEAAAINARQATGQSPGVEMLRDFKNSMFKSSLLTPQGIQQQGLGAYQPLQQEAVNAAINEERSGFPRVSEPPAWAQGGIQLNPMGSLTGRSGFKQGIVEGAPQQQSTMDLAAIPDDVLQRIAGGK